MKKIFNILLFVFWASTFANAQTITVSTDNITANAGDTILVAINVADLSNVGAITIKMQYDQNVLEFISAVNWNAQINGALANGTNGVAIISWSDLTPANISNGKLVDFKFVYKGGTSALTFLASQSEIADINANILAVNYTDGSVSANPPAAPTLSSPANNSTGISTTPTLFWNPVTDADTYHLQIGDDENFASIIKDTVLADTSYQVTSALTNNTPHWWRVSATNAGGTSDWSSVYSFTTKLATPTLISPADNATEVSLTPTLTWSEVTGADTYRLEANTKNDLTGTVVYDKDTVSLASIQIGGLTDNTKYYWRVTALNNAGNLSDTSSTFNFTTIFSAPSNLTAMILGTTIIKVRLDWENNSNNYTGIVIERDDNDSTNYVVIDSVTIGISSYTDSLLNTGHNYYYRVKAYNTSSSSIYVYASSGIITDVESFDNLLPKEYTLYQNYPNPFNPSTTIRYTIPKQSFVTIKTYNVLGEEIKTLVNKELNIGVYEVNFDASNLASGIYFYSLKAGDFFATKKLVLMK